MLRTRGQAGGKFHLDEFALADLEGTFQAMNRQPFGGQYNSMWKVVMALSQLCKADVNKDIIIKAGAVPLLTRLLQLPPDRRSARLIEHACLSCWHISFNPSGKAQLCEQTTLVDALSEVATDDVMPPAPCPSSPQWPK